MSGDLDLTDSSDWKNTRAPFFSGIESTLRCHICKELMTAPVLTVCCHTFCSLCIRSHLNEEDSCPVCRSKTQSSSLRKNTAVEELITLYKKHRKQLLELLSFAEEDKEPPEETKEEAVTGSDDTKLDAVEGEEDPDLRRSKRRRTEVNYQEADPNMAECPVCGKRMKVSEIESTHISECLSGGAEKPKKPMTNFIAETDDMSKKLSAIAYNLYSFSKLQEVAKKLGIPSNGPKQSLEQRHKQWVTLWNANADSKYPEPKSHLLSKLNKWEKQQQIQAKNSTSKLDMKNLDGNEWVTQHQGDFASLLAQARANAKKAAAPKSSDDNKDTTNDTD